MKKQIYNKVGNEQTEGKPALEDVLKAIDSAIQTSYCSDTFNPVGIISNILALKKAYIEATEGLTYNTKEKNEQLAYRRIDIFEQIYRDIQQIHMIELCDKRS